MTEGRFRTDYIEWSDDISLKAGRAYVTGFISTDEVDLYREVVTPEAMKSMVDQLNAGNVKLDIDHGQYKGKQDIPIGKIIEAKMVQDGGRAKIWVKAEINTSHSRFGEVWKSIKDRFLDAFSIAYKIQEAGTAVVNGAQVKLLKAIELLNVAITGDPVNRGARMTDAFMKSLNEVKPMAEDNKQEATAPQIDFSAELKSMKDEMAKSADEAETKLKSYAETVEKLQAELKATVEASDAAKKEIAELKAVLEKPVFKSMASREQAQVDIKATPLMAIR